MVENFDLLMFNPGSGGGKKKLPKGAFSMLKPSNGGSRANRSSSTNRTNRKKSS